MQRSGVSGSLLLAGVALGLVVGLAIMYVAAPWVFPRGGGNPTLTTTSTSTTTATVTKTVSGGGGTTVTTTFTGEGTTVTTTVTQGGSGSTVTTTVTTTASGGLGFKGGVVFVTIPAGTGSEQSLNFSPSSLTVVLGVNNTVVWTNDDSVDHTVTADILKMFNVVLHPGESFGYTFGQAGTFGYSCQFHGWMIASVTVKP